MKKAKLLRDLTNDAELLLERLGNDQSQEVRELRERLNKTLSEAKEAMADAQSRANEAIKNYAVSVDDYVHDSPWVAQGTAVAAAGVMGFLAGSLLNNNRRLWS
ncbi:MAG TPA: DUF883 family protein [Steroidobacteraceae bacterium]|nr:DUF883 family protein [Steroidobacteraceae bacterium]